jgi:hypothetical protein
LVRAQPAVERGCVVAVDVDLGEHWEIDVVLGGRELEDLCVRARLLAGELVTGEGEDVEPLVAELFLKRTQTCVLRRKASSARYVDDQADLVLKLGEGHLVPGDRLHLEICECHACTIPARAFTPVRSRTPW